MSIICKASPYQRAKGARRGLCLASGGESIILLINLCADPLHTLEFVRPVEEIVKRTGAFFTTKHYSDLDDETIKRAERIILCGTSLQDSQYAHDLADFEFLKRVSKPVLGICAGMQIIALLFGAALCKKSEIGFYKERFKKSFLGLEGETEVFHLHNYYPSLPRGFTRYTESGLPQAFTHKNFYGVLFHPEVRQQQIIENFCKNLSLS